MVTQPFGQTLWSWRVHRGMTQGQLAARAKVARPNLSAIERGQREVSLSTLRRLALALDVRPGLLVDGVLPAEASAFLSRATIERVADAVAFGRPLARPGEREAAAALRTLLGHRTSAINFASQNLSTPRCRVSGTKQPGPPLDINDVKGSEEVRISGGATGSARGASTRRCGVPPRISRRAAVSAWLTLKNRYSPEAIRVLADRVAERQRLHAAPDYSPFLPHPGQ